MRRAASALTCGAANGVAGDQVVTGHWCEREGVAGRAQHVDAVGVCVLCLAALRTLGAEGIDYAAPRSGEARRARFVVGRDHDGVLGEQFVQQGFQHRVRAAGERQVDHLGLQVDGGVQRQCQSEGVATAGAIGFGFPARAQHLNLCALGQTRDGLMASGLSGEQADHRGTVMFLREAAFAAREIALHHAAAKQRRVLGINGCINHGDGNASRIAGDGSQRLFEVWGRRDLPRSALGGELVKGLQPPDAGV